MIFRNLEAEQRRYGMTDEDMGRLLGGMCRQTYGTKKKTGTFTVLQIETLLSKFNCKFEYLFQTDSNEDRGA